MDNQKIRVLLSSEMAAGASFHRSSENALVAGAEFLSQQGASLRVEVGGYNMFEETEAAAATKVRP